MKKKSISPNKIAAATPIQAKTEDKYSRYRAKHREKLAHDQRLRYRAKMELKKIQNKSTLSKVEARIQNEDLTGHSDHLYNLRNKRITMTHKKYVEELGQYATSITNIMLIQQMGTDIPPKQRNTTLIHNHCYNNPTVKSTATARVLDNNQVTVQLKNANGTAVDHLLIKRSTINGAGLGVFAQKTFKVGDFIGIYTGQYRSTIPKNVSYTAIYETGYVNAAHGHLGMGMHFINDYYYGKKKQPRRALADDKTNVTMTDDLLVWATKSINIGEELFMDYNLVILNA